MSIYKKGSDSGGDGRSKGQDGCWGHGNGQGGCQSGNGFPFRKKAMPETNMPRRGPGIIELEKILKEQERVEMNKRAKVESFSSLNNPESKQAFPPPTSLRMRSNLNRFTPSPLPIYGFGNTSSLFGHNTRNGRRVALNAGGSPPLFLAKAFPSFPNPRPQVLYPQRSCQKMSSSWQAQEKMFGAKRSRPWSPRRIQSNTPHYSSLSRNSNFYNSELRKTIPSLRDATYDSEFLTLSCPSISLPSRQIIGQKHSKYETLSSQTKGAVVELQKHGRASEAAEGNPFFNFLQTKREENNCGCSETEDDSIDLTLRL